MQIKPSQSRKEKKRAYHVETKKNISIQRGECDSPKARLGWRTAPGIAGCGLGRARLWLHNEHKPSAYMVSMVVIDVIVAIPRVDVL